MLLELRSVGRTRLSLNHKAREETKDNSHAVTTNVVIPFLGASLIYIDKLVFLLQWVPYNINAVSLACCHCYLLIVDYLPQLLSFLRSHAVVIDVLIRKAQKISASSNIMPSLYSL